MGVSKSGEIEAMGPKRYEQLCPEIIDASWRGVTPLEEEIEEVEATPRGRPRPELQEGGGRFGLLSPEEYGGMASRWIGSNDECFAAAANAVRSMWRIDNPAELAKAAVWMCSPRASSMTGATVSVDGGYTTR